VTRLHPRTGSKAAPPSAPAALRDTITTFLATCRNPALLEYGDEAVRLRPGEYSLEIRTDRLWIEAWGETRSIARRILTIERHSPGVLDCTVHRFGGKPGKLSFLDLDRPQTAHKAHFGTRQNFAEQFRRMLYRQFPGWEIAALSCGLDLQRSLSSVFPRAWLTRGNHQIAALACPSLREEPSLLTFALLWHNHLRLHGCDGTQTSLALFLPDTAGNLTAHRLRWLTAQPLNARLFRFNVHGSAGEVDGRDLGNLDTRLRAAADHAERVIPDPPPASACVDSSERSLEARVRSNPAAIEASLLPEPIYG
jgi:hypothetical protein